MIKAMQCRDGAFRVEHEDGTIYIYDDYKELAAHYNILGVLANSMFLTFIVTRKDDIQ